MTKFDALIFVPINAMAVILGWAFLIDQELTLWRFLLVVLGWVFISGLGVSVALHRVFSHRTHRPKPWLKLILLFFATLACEGPSILWCAFHRGTHHPYSDTDKDPQRVDFSRGVWVTLYGWKKDIGKNTNARSVPDLIRDRHHVFAYNHYYKLVWLVWVLTALIDFEVFVFGIVFPTFLSVWLNNLENIVSHVPALGYRTFETKDNSTNVWWFQPFGWGGGALHNNHHARPAEFNFSYRWWEYDPSTIFLPLLRLGSTK